MEHIKFFKLQAKNFLRDYSNRELKEDGIYRHNNPKFFQDIDDIIVSYDIDEYGKFTLMNAQHIIALLSGFHNWTDLIHANKAQLELGRLLLEHRNHNDVFPFIEYWKMYLESNNLSNFDDETKLEIFKIVFLS